MKRRLGKAGILATFAALCAATALAQSAPLPDWGYLRRHGDAALMASLRTRLAPLPWQTEYVEQRLPPTHPFARLRMTVARAPGPHLGGALFRFEAPESLRGVGVVAWEGKVFVHLPGRPVEAATPELLAAPLPLLGVPLLVLIATETTALFDQELVGEFGEVGIYQFVPRYEAGPALPRMKMAVQKRTVTLDALQVIDRQSVLVAGAQWQHVASEQGLFTAHTLALRPESGDQGTLELTRGPLHAGPTEPPTAFDASALR